MIKARWLRFSHWLRAVLVVSVVTSIDVWAQTPNGPTQTQCKLWDDTYLAMFHVAFGAALLGTVVTCFLIPLLGRRWWWATEVRRRIVIITLSVMLAVVLFVGVWPLLLGFGHSLFSGVGPRYPECASLRFGAEGLYYGWFGTGVSAIAQWPMIIVLLAAAAAFGGMIAYILSMFLVPLKGLPSKVRGSA